jgi:hypothetical protein
VSEVRVNSVPKRGGKKKHTYTQLRKNPCIKLNQFAKLLIAIIVNCGFRVGGGESARIRCYGSVPSYRSYFGVAAILYVVTYSDIEMAVVMLS